MNNKPGIIFVKFISVFIISLILNYAAPGVDGIGRAIILAGVSALSTFSAIKFFNKRYYSS